MSKMVIGVGNELRGDDGAGLEVVRRLRNVTAVESRQGSYELLDLWGEAEEVIVVDAARSGSPPGTIHRFDAVMEPLPTGLLGTGTHTIGVAETVEMARRLDRLPPALIVYGVEVGSLSTGEGLTPAVDRAVELLAREIDGA
jgi:hydrogenase maturation protease